MEAAVIVDLPATTTNDVNKKIVGLREEGGAITLGRVLTLVIALDTDDVWRTRSRRPTSPAASTPAGSSW